MMLLTDCKNVNRFALCLTAIMATSSAIASPAFAFETFGILTEEESKEEYLLDPRIPKDAPHNTWGHWMCFTNKGVRYRCRRFPNGTYRQNISTGIELTGFEKPLRFELGVAHTRKDCISYLMEIKPYIVPFKNFCVFAERLSSYEPEQVYELSRIKSKRGLWTFPATEP